MKKIIAHVRIKDNEQQPLIQHLREVSRLSGLFANKLDMPRVGQLLGLMHDFGKFSEQFQNYIQSAVGLLNPDIDDEWVDANVLKGKIDHSSAGAKWVWEAFNKHNNTKGKLCGQIIALCIASHHSGLIDCLKPDGENGFAKRMCKSDDKTHFDECILSADPEILQSAENLATQSLIDEMWKFIEVLKSSEQNNQKNSYTIKYFYIGFYTRFLFSCLVDADRINSADFENPHFLSERNYGTIDWDIPINRLEQFLKNLPVIHVIDNIRKEIAEHCFLKSPEKQGIYSLTVPTGGGKTYASLRFALHHAKKHQLDRIIYIVPYTSIIEQNAEAIRQVIESKDDHKNWVLEHHSNLEPEHQSWRSKLASENWDSPIVLTTMVQFLETLFSGGTRGVRRLHQLARSVIIFDEIQTLPIKMTHLFCNSINFLTNYARTSVVLCTATQPLLDKLRSAEKGQLFIPVENELIKNKVELFNNLKRANILNKITTKGWTIEEIVDLSFTEFQQNGSCLVIVNTKNWAQKLFTSCAKKVSVEAIFHLSTNQCAAHRQFTLKTIKDRLKQNLPVLCISTQLIEAGVDIDFCSVIRFLAGLDSIAQAAGRCNRNGKLNKANVHIINPDLENVDLLPEIKVGKEISQRIFSESKDEDWLSPYNIQRYFEYYFYQRFEEMAYPLSAKQIGHSDTLLNLLSENTFNCANKEPYLMLRQSFMTAGKAFNAIDAPTESIIVPYGKGQQIIIDLCAIDKHFDIARYYHLLKSAQKYSINIYPNVKNKLIELQAIHEIQQGEGIYYLDIRNYHDFFGLTMDPSKNTETFIC